MEVINLSYSNCNLVVHIPTFRSVAVLAFPHLLRSDPLRLSHMLLHLPQDVIEPGRVDGASRMVDVTWR